jgi:hypothetical protein
MSKNLLDLMPKEARERAIARAEKRLAKRTGQISPEMYLVAEAGYYFGWEAIVAIKRGYIEYTGKDGTAKQSILTLEEVSTLVDAARKVWYTKVLDQSLGNMNANISANTKTPMEAYKQTMKPFMDEVGA